MKQKMTELSCGTMTEDTVKCMGWKVRYLEDVVNVSQRDYIQSEVEFLDIDKGDNHSNDLVQDQEKICVAI